MADQFLSQEEVDALLDGVNGEGPAPGADDTNGVRTYDLGTQERIVRGRMPTLEIINERFARNLRLGLFNFIRRNPEISAGQSKVQKYSAFLRNIVVPTNLNVVQVRPLRGQALVICEPSLVFTIIDNLFGGSGRIHTRIEGRDFSATEQRIILRIVELISEEYRKAWDGVYPINFEYVRSEMNTQFANIATPNEVVVSTTFVVELGTISGEMHFCTPYAMIEPIRDLLTSSLQGETLEMDKRWIRLMKQQIQTAEVELVIDLATTTLTLSKVLALQKGDVLPLQIAPLLEAKVDGVPVMHCLHGQLNGQYALRVEQLLMSSQNDHLQGDDHV